MIDIDELTRLIEKKPLPELIYSREKERFLTLEELKKVDTSKDEYDLCYFLNSSMCYGEARTNFRLKHQDIFPKAPSSYSHKKWYDTIVANGLEEEWFYELRQSLASNVTNFSKHYGIQEIEAEQSLYDEIKEELIHFELKHYERKYSDLILFLLPCRYEFVTMMILGNAGQTFGVSFYPGELFGNTNYRIQMQEDLMIDQHTLYCLSNMVSFYFEKGKKKSFEYTDNPYGKSNDYSSVYMTNGSLMNTFLPKSIAIRSLEYLKLANKRMPIFNQTESRKIVDDRYYEVSLLEDKSYIFPIELEDKTNIDLLPELDEVNFQVEKFKLTAKGKLDMTIRALPNYFVDDRNPEKCVHFGFLVLACDHKSGNVDVAEIGEAKDFILFDELCYHLSQKLKTMTVPREICVNNFLDYAFFTAYFRPYIERGQMKVVPSIKRLLSDEAAESFIDMLEANEDFVTETKYKS